MYGFVMAPLEDGQTIDDDKRQLSNLKLEASGNQWIFVYSQLLDLSGE
jgi:hypothetical protein